MKVRKAKEKTQKINLWLTYLGYFCYNQGNRNFSKGDVESGKITLAKDMKNKEIK